ncbi:DUF7550 family protein [Halarchaeum rubridurum]
MTPCALWRPPCESENGKCRPAEGERMDTTHEGRTTSPMQPFTTKQVAYGAVAFAVGAIITFVLPFLG